MLLGELPYTLSWLVTQFVHVFPNPPPGHFPWSLGQLAAKHVQTAQRKRHSAGLRHRSCSAALACQWTTCS